MTINDAVGYLASGLVLAAFCMKDIVPLRAVALCSNLAFLIYGLSMDLVPIWLLHALLLPMNGWRLIQALLAKPSMRAVARENAPITRLIPAAEALPERPRGSPRRLHSVPVRKGSEVFGRSAARPPQCSGSIGIMGRSGERTGSMRSITLKGAPHAT
jgi:hypothetical protein